MRPDARYVALAEPGGDGLRPPPARGKPPKYPSHNKKRKRSCGCLCCCCCCCLLVLIVALALAALFVFINPQAPSYSVKNLSVSSFDVSDDTLHVNISVSIRAENPNKRIGITYGRRSKAELSFRGAELCSAVLPSFYQGHGNVTTMDVMMQGSSKFGKEEQEELAAGQKSGSIPLRLRVVVPIKLKVMGADTKMITFTVSCTMVVDNIHPSKRTGIKSATYDVRWHYD